MNVLMA